MMKRIQRTKVFLIGAILVVAILVAFTAGAGGNSGTQGSSTDVVHVVGSNAYSGESCHPFRVQSCHLPTHLIPSLI